MIRRAGSSAEALHLLHEEWDERARVLYPCFCLLVEVGLVGRASALHHAQEAVLHALGSLYVNLCGQVATGIHLVIHIQRSILRIAQVVLGVGVIHALGKSFLVLKASPHLLTFLAVYDSRASILAEGQLSLASHLGIPQHGESHEFVVLRCFGVVKYRSHLLVMLSAQHEVHIMKRLCGEQLEGFL